MHEMSLAIGLMERVTEEARRAGLSRVTRVEIEVGALQAVEPDLLIEAFRAVAERGLAQGAIVSCSSSPARARCRGCGHEFSPTYILYACPSCHQADVEILSGRSMYLKSLSGEAPE